MNFVIFQFKMATHRMGYPVSELEVRTFMFCPVCNTEAICRDETAETTSIHAPMEQSLIGIHQLISAFVSNTLVPMGRTWPFFCHVIFNWLCTSLQEAFDKMSGLREVSPGTFLVEVHVRIHAFQVNPVGLASIAIGSFVVLVIYHSPSTPKSYFFPPQDFSILILCQRKGTFQQDSEKKNMTLKHRA